MGFTNILRSTTIKNNKRIVEVTQRTGEIQIAEQELNTRITTFEAVKKFFPNAIGMEYKSVLPKDFLLDCFNGCEDTYELDHNTISDTERSEKTVEYINELTSLIKTTKSIIRPVVEVVSSIGSTKNSFKDVEYSKFTIKNELVVGKQCERCDHTFENGGEHYPVQAEITFPNFKTVKTKLSETGFIEKLLSNVPIILSRLNDLSNLSAYLDGKSNSFRNFAAEIFISMNGNYNAAFPRSIVNYSAFQFSLPGYPFNTPTSHVYSISNVPSDIKNKYQLEELYIKNISATADFLADSLYYLDNDLNDISSDNANIETQTQSIKLIYAIAIVLTGLYGEKTLWDGMLSGKLKFKDIHKQCQLLDSNTGERFNECKRHI